MTDQVKTNAFALPAYRVGELRVQLEKLNKKADKLGCPHVTFSILSSAMVPDPSFVTAYIEAYGSSPSADEASTFPKTEVHEIVLEGAGPKIDGYKFVGTLDHVTMPGNVIVQAVPGEKVPQEFFHIEPVCAHCNKIRRRAETFVLQQDDGNHIQVGRNCLRDFFGHDPSAIVRFLTKVMCLAGEMQDEDRERSGMRMGDYAYVDKLKSLSTTVAVIRTYGWLSKTAAQNGGGRATVAVVREVMFPTFGREDTAARERLMREIKWDEAKDAAEATAAIEWLAQQPNDVSNEYMHNLHLLSAANMVPQKMLGYWVSLIAAFQRDQERLQRMKASTRLNEYFGTVGERVDVRITCQDAKSSAGMYGPLTIYRMQTEAGHTLMWFANTGDTKMTIGGRYDIRGRIKKHDEYKGYKQTHLSRVTVVSQVEAAE